LIRRAGVEGVFLVDGQGHARFRSVRAGDSSGGRVQILAGLKTGEQVVGKPPSGLADGDLITER
jgi:multidrug efflux pump subunit AcrA (membrane-fusion protein)